MTIREMLSASASTNDTDCIIHLRPYYEHDAEANTHHSDTSTLCERRCGLLLYDALDKSSTTTSYTNVPITSPLRGGWPALASLIDPIEHMSFCETCPKEPTYRNYLHTICDGIVRQYKNFYQVLFRHYKRIDFKTIYCDSRDNDYIFMQYINQIDRILESISRLADKLAYQSVYDGDSWYIVYNQAERLSDATHNLRERVLFSRT
ncbi:hypothetical protein ASPCADRAFT_204024 [Aspergillus carbonarius ITEM 5010]|uniref:Uncharacterized protein n=1 Tax=Aspergillus carbonarius (strain ITEM 5010) TaxID=602072 RepID=A0A1R3S0C0_ASPC5|nr:hypothetical protein ASPCADRAFT_204024 [Aspergillus carbonarius ITEM 5010]